MNIDKSISYEFGSLEFINYTQLIEEELLTVLEYRNHIDVRKMMHNPDEITKQEHFNFINKLKIETINYYWIVKKKEKIVGSVYLTKVDSLKKNAFWGLFLNPKYIGTGLGVEIEFESMKLFFQEFKFNIIKGEVLERNNDSHSIQIKLNFKEIKNQSSCSLYQLIAEDWTLLPETFKQFKLKYLLR
jgi:UDP-4-amino-4,6-dideoxy-N-acetyl-beta-L-altrosamine N-acetyltransferase